MTAGRRLAPAVAVLVVVSLTGCSAGGVPASGQHGAAAPVGVQATPALGWEPGQGSTVEQTIAVLASAGIATVSDEASTEPVVPVSGPTVATVVRWQAEAMAGQSIDHGGISGADLDAVLPLPGSFRMDQLLAGWALGSGTPAARAADDLLGTFDFSGVDQLVFPDEVLELFVADARKKARSSTTSSPLRAADRPDPAGG